MPETTMEQRLEVAISATRKAGLKTQVVLGAKANGLNAEERKAVITLVAKPHAAHHGWKLHQQAAALQQRGSSEGGSNPAAAA